MYSKPLIRKGLRKGVARYRITAEQFRDARVFSGFDRQQAADFLGVSLRTIGHWETGRARPSYAALRLLRVYRHGEIIEPGWAAYRFVRGGLITPEGHRFEPADMVWQSLLVRQAHEFRRMAHQRRESVREGGKPGEARIGPSGVRPALVAPPVQLVPLPAITTIADPLGGLPSSNRGVSETERTAGEAVSAPNSGAATLPQAGVAAPTCCAAVLP